MGTKLFDDGDDAQNDDISKIEINKEYAGRFEHNKRREDLQRYEELKKRGQVDESDEESDEESSSSSPDDDDEEEEKFNEKATLRKKDENFFEALIRVRNRDPRLKDKNVKLFESDDDESKQEEPEQKEKKDKKAMYLKDVVAKHLIEEGPDFQERDASVEQKKKVKSYDEEQEEIKKAFLDAVEEIDKEEDGDFLKVKEKKGKDEEEEHIGDGEFSKKLDEYFGDDEKMDENTKFLKDFFKNKMWMDKERTGGDFMVDSEAVDELLKDEKEIERQEGYELEYNFRHEENAEDRVMGHSRIVEGSVRKKESKRKGQRERKEERKRIVEMERKEELKHLKNLKKEEIKERMKKVMEIAGIKKDEECPFSAKDLEKEFDPEEYDKMMKAVFDDKYYDDEDKEFNSDTDGFEKPDFDKEDELLGLPKGWDVLESCDGFLAARERNKHKLQSGGSDDIEGEELGEKEGKQKNEEEEEEEDEVEDVDDKEEEDDDDDEERKEEETEEGKRKRKRKMSVVQKALQEMWEEFYKLDYEDTIGDLKTRFTYVKVKPNRYGLKPKEIVALDDKELNQFVSLKMLAPYRDKEWKVHNNMRYQQKLRIRELLKDKTNGRKAGKKRSTDAAEQSTSGFGGGMENKEAKLEDAEGKKKRSQSSNISESRRKAYGMISSKSKKNKHKH